MNKTYPKNAMNIKSYQEIKDNWEKIQSLDFRNRMKAMRAIAHDIYMAYQAKELDFEQKQDELEFYMAVLKQINKVHDIPRAKRLLSKIISDWLKLTGNDDVVIHKKMTGKLALETASIGIGDSSYKTEVENAYANYTEKNILNLLNEGKIFIFGTGADGICNTQIRIIAGLEPVLSAKEFKCVINNSETAVIHCPTGVIMVGDPGNFYNNDMCIFFEVLPGNYKICVYHFEIRNKLDSFYVVLCKTNDVANNNLVKLPQLG